VLRDDFVFLWFLLPRIGPVRDLLRRS